MIGIIIGTFAGTVIALLVWEFWREAKKVRAADPSAKPGWVKDTIDKAQASHRKSEGKQP